MSVSPASTICYHNLPCCG